MNKKLLMIGLVSGLLFSSCQTEDASNNEPNEPNIQAIHEPVFIIGGTIEAQSEWFNDHGFSSCDDYPLYQGKSDLAVTRNDNKSFHGDFNFSNLSVGGTLSYCGIVNVENTVTVHWAGVLNYIGEIFIGTHEQPSNLIINHGGHLNLFGHVDVSGDFVMNDGATLHFAGGDPDKFLIEVDGNIKIADDVVMDEGIVVDKEAGLIYFQHED